MNGGLILPGDISIYLRGLDPEECQTDEIEGKWTFPFPADYKFLGAKVGKKILRAFGFIFPTTMQYTPSRTPRISGLKSQILKPTFLS